MKKFLLILFIIIVISNLSGFAYQGIFEKDNALKNADVKIKEYINSMKSEYNNEYKENKDENGNEIFVGKLKYLKDKAIKVYYPKDHMFLKLWRDKGFNDAFLHNRVIIPIADDVKPVGMITIVKKSDIPSRIIDAGYGSSPPPTDDKLEVYTDIRFNIKGNKSWLDFIYDEKLLLNKVEEKGIGNIKDIKVILGETYRNNPNIYYITTEKGEYVIPYYDNAFKNGEIVELNSYLDSAIKSYDERLEYYKNNPEADGGNGNIEISNDLSSKNKNMLNPIPFIYIFVILIALILAFLVIKFIIRKKKPI